MSHIYRKSKLWENKEKFRQIYQQYGKEALLDDKDFKQVIYNTRVYLIDLGRYPDYTILDRDARKLFPNFTKILV